ncbi:MAG: type II toxin-antitoxin system mRNA interferase toxin, RelE/StbE family [Candidatus Pacebacteria bacterium]|nr:type II toxin-antitoxin system mRNA interferase toxin, RelE/StbE family [Candidatus Paceibacterota bacterium]
MKTYFHKNFDKQFRKLGISEKKKAQERLQLFLENPFNPILENHPLKGKYTDYRSINITGDLRAIYKLINDNECIFVAVDTHSNLYF